MSKEQELIKQAEKLALLSSSENPVEKLKELLKNEADYLLVARFAAFFYIAVDENFLDKYKNKLINQAKRLINTYPLPDDAEQQLEQLLNLASSDIEKLELEGISNILFRKRNNAVKKIKK